VLALPWGNTETPGAGVLILPTVGLAVIVTAAVLAAARRDLTIYSPLVATAGLAVLPSLFAALIAPDPDLALRLVAISLFGLCWAALLATVGRHPRALAVIVGLLLAVGALQCAIALPAAAQLQTTAASEAVAGRLTGSFGQPNELGCFAAAISVVALGVAITARRTLVVLGAAVAATLALAALLLSLSRGAWLGAALGMAVLAAAAPSGRRRLGYALGVMTMVGAVVVAIAPSGSTVDVVGQRSGTVLNATRDPTDQRPAIWEEALRQIRTAPVFGHGPGSFSATSRTPGSAIPNSEISHAHNLALTTAAETGLLGLALLLMAIVVGLYSVVRVRRHPPPGAQPDIAVAAAAGLAAVLGQGLLDYPLRNAVLALITWLLVGLLCAATAGFPSSIGAVTGDDAHRVPEPSRSSPPTS
jgi:O-antigen ligase